jgi:hypothetical protein
MFKGEKTLNYWPNLVSFGQKARKFLFLYIHPSHDRMSKKTSSRYCPFKDGWRLAQKATGG